MKNHDRIAEELLAPLAGEYDPTLEDRRRIREKIRAQVAGSTAASTAQAKSNTGTRVVTKLAGVVGASAVIALGVLAYETRRPDAADAHAPVSSALSIPAESAEPIAAPPPSIDVATAIGVESLPSAPPPNRPPSPAPRRPTEPVQASSEDDLAKETQILGEAARASREGNVDRALLLLDEHARQFPRGALADERVVARILALCRAGRQSEARAEGRTFLATHAPSPLHRRVSESCVGTEASAPEVHK